MLPYYADVFERAFWAIPSLLGSNVLGIIWPVLVVICGEILACFIYGWRTMIAKWKQASLIGFAALGMCYTALFAWSILSTVYRDHTAIDSRNQELKVQTTTLQTVIDGNAAREKNAVLVAENKCAEMVGENRTMSKQNRDQQNTINNCQTQAVKLLTPEPLKVSLLVIDRDLDLIDPKHLKFRDQYVLVANKSLPSSAIMVSCDKPIMGLFAFQAGGASFGQGVGFDDVAQIQTIASIHTPEVSPTVPAIIDIDHRLRNMQCQFQMQ